MLRSILTSLLVIGCAWPVLAREWHAREGGFSINAELVNLRDGSVILKRDDNGQEIAVPLAKLSLSDIRFVHTELARLSDATKGDAPIKMPSAAASSPSVPPRTPISPPATPAPAKPTIDATSRLSKSYPEMPRKEVEAPPLAEPEQTNWQAAPDPNPFDYALPKDKEVKSIAPSDGGTFTPLFSEHPSHFAFFQKSIREFYAFHLPTQKIVSILKFDSFVLGHSQVSPDGRYLAFSIRNKKSYKLEVQIWSFETGKLVQLIPAADNFDSITAIRFAGPDRLLIISDSDDTWLYYEIETGRLICSAKDLSFSSTKSLAVSPGGSYVTFGDNKNKIQLVDLRTGAVAGTIGGREVLDSSLQIEQATFSPDGEELLVYAEGSKKGRVLVWDLRSGDKIVDLLFPLDFKYKAPSGVYYSGRPLEWRPDRSGWLVYGSLLIERNSTEIIWIDKSKSEADTSFKPRRFVDNDRLLVFEMVKQQMTMSLLEIPNEQLAETRAMFASGATAIDQGLPPLTPVNIGDRQELETATQWSYQPDVAPKVAAGALQNNIQLTSGGSQISTLQICNPSNRAVLSLIEINADRRLPGSFSFEPQYFDLIDLAAGKAMQRTSLPFPTKLMAVAPSGDWAAFAMKEGEDRIDLFDLTTGKPALAFRPFKSGAAKIKGMAFGSDRANLWVLDSEGMLTHWKLPECRAVSQRKYDSLTRLTSSPSGRTLCVAAMRRVELFDADVGKMLGALASSPDGKKPGPADYAFSDDGKKLACASLERGGPQTITLWDLTGNIVAQTFEIPGKPHAMSWGSDLSLLVYMLKENSKGRISSHLAAVDLVSERIAWKYTLPFRGEHGYRGPDGLHWYIAGDTDSEVLILRSAELPQRTEAERIAALKPLARLLRRGDRLAVNIDSEIPMLKLQHQNIVSDLKDAYITTAKRRGYVFDPNADYLLTVDVKEQLTPESISVQLARSDTIHQIQITEAIAILKITNRDGKLVWGEEMRVRTSNDFTRGFYPENTNLSDFLRTHQWRRLENWLFDRPLTGAVFAEPAASAGIGTSSLTPQSVEIQPTITPQEGAGDLAI